VVPARKWYLAQRHCLPCHGKNFQLYSATEGHPESTVEYRDDVRVLHIEPITYQGVQIIKISSPPDVSKLEGIAATSELFKHRDLDATLVVHAIERKHNDRYHLYWYITSPTVVAILVTIGICKEYPYLFRTLLRKILCTTRPAEKPTTGNKSQSLPEVSPEMQPSTRQLQNQSSGGESEFVTHPVQTTA
jgi:hypothetical protein